MKNFLQIALVAMVAFFFTGQDLIAQKGVYVGIKLAGTSVSFDDFESSGDTNGGGLELDLGYNFSNKFGLFTTFGGYKLDDSDVTLGYFDIGSRFFLGSSNTFRPYLDVALTGSSFNDDSDNVDSSLSGGGLSGGGGVQFFFNDNVALNLGLLISRINYNEVKVGNISVDDLDYKSTNTRLKLGLAFYF